MRETTVWEAIVAKLPNSDFPVKVLVGGYNAGGYSVGSYSGPATNFRFSSEGSSGRLQCARLQRGKLQWPSCQFQIFE